MRAWAGAGVLAAAACAHAPPPPSPAAPLRFADSEAFAAVRPHTFALLERDLDGDGLADAVVVRRTDAGWAAVAFHHQRDEQGERWTTVCQAEPLPGPELDQVRWIELADGPLLLVSAIDEDPDDVVQHLFLVDPADECGLRLRERLLLVRPETAEVISPGIVPAGIGGEAGVLQLIDQPQLIHLEGAAGAVELLAGVRRRLVQGSRQVVDVTEQRLQFLAPRPLTLGHLIASEGAPDLAPLGDGDDATAVIWPAGVAASLTLESAAPLRLLEVRWGCAAGEGTADLALTVTAGQAAPYLLGTPVPVGGAVLAVGRQHQLGEHTFKALVALRDGATAAQLELGAATAQRCLREVVGYGFR